MPRRGAVVLRVCERSLPAAPSTAVLSAAGTLGACPEQREGPQPRVVETGTAAHPALGELGTQTAPTGLSRGSATSTLAQAALSTEH